MHNVSPCYSSGLKVVEDGTTRPQYCQCCYRLSHWSQSTSSRRLFNSEQLKNSLIVNRQVTALENHDFAKVNVCRRN